jgi:hypothetical protein
MACQTNSSVEVLDPIKENYDNYLLIDVGSNMVNKKFSRDLESVLQRAKDSGEFDILNVHINIPHFIHFTLSFEYLIFYLFVLNLFRSNNEIGLTIVYLILYF